MLNDMVICVQHHTKVSKQAMLLDSIDVGPPPHTHTQKKYMYVGLLN